ncbi:hypothetical protein BDV12DRAFT_186299 [Aspergillus spectabilis]
MFQTCSISNIFGTKIHTSIQKNRKGFFCGQCYRGFSSQAALEQHQKSLVHRPLSNLECIDSRCQKGFKSPSALLHHLESGTCLSGMDRGKLNGIIYVHDNDHMITDQTQPSQNYALDDTLSTCSDYSTESRVIYTPSSTISISSLCLAQTESPEVHISDLEMVNFGGIPCNDCSRTFKSLQSLRQHRQSAAHTSARFTCPINLLGKKHTITRSFTTISGLAQHLEAGACAGGSTMLRDATRYLETCLQSMGFKRRILLNDTSLLN